MINRRQILSAAAIWPVTTFDANGSDMLPVQRVNALARKLSQALDEWNGDVGSPMGARVLPASFSRYPVIFENLDPPSERQSLPSEFMRRFSALSAEHDAIIEVLHREIDREDHCEEIGDHQGQQEAESSIFALHDELDVVLDALFSLRPVTLGDFRHREQYLASLVERFPHSDDYWTWERMCRLFNVLQLVKRETSAA